MTDERQSGTDRASREVFVTRWFDAPRSMVWKAWSTPEHLNNWFGPRGFSLTTDRFELKEGGVWKFIMHGPDGREYTNMVRFEKVVEERLLVYNQGDHEVESDQSLQMEVTVTFEEENDGTRLTILSTFASPEKLQKVIREYGAIEGGFDTFQRLGNVLETFGARSQRGVTVCMPNEREIIVRRFVNAPAEVVFDIWVDAPNWHKWLGPDGFEIVKAEMNAEPGGSFELRQRAQNGMEGGMRGDIVEVHRPTLLTAWQYFMMGELDPIKHFVTISFAEHADGTDVSIAQVFESTDVRNQWFEWDRDGGMQESFEKLDFLIAD